MSNPLKSWLLSISLLSVFWAIPQAKADTIRVGAIDSGIQGYISIPLLEKAYERAGIDLSIHRFPRQRVLAEFKDRTVDGVATRLYALPTHIPGITRVEPSIFKLSVKAYVRAQSDIQVSAREDLAGLSVVILRGSIISKTATEFAQERIEVSKPQQMLEMLVNGRIDAVIGPSYAVEVGLAQTGYGANIKGLDVTLTEALMYHYLDEKFAVEAALVSEQLLKMQESGEMAAISEAGWHELLGDAVTKGF